MMQRYIIELPQNMVVGQKYLLKHSPSMPERPHISIRAITGKTIRLTWVGKAVSGVMKSSFTKYHPMSIAGSDYLESFHHDHYMVEVLSLILVKKGVITYLEKAPCWIE